jgi:hypothetical protein
MPGTNEYSMAPELRASTTTTAPTLVAKPKPASTSGNLNSGIPQIYTTRTYDPTTFDEAAFAESLFRTEYGLKASKQDAKDFDKFKTTEDYTKALEAAKATAKADFDASEHKKWSDSYKAYATAIAAQHRSKV